MKIFCNGLFMGMLKILVLVIGLFRKFKLVIEIVLVIKGNCYSLWFDIVFKELESSSNKL